MTSLKDGVTDFTRMAFTTILSASDPSMTSNCSDHYTSLRAGICKPDTRQEGAAMRNSKESDNNGFLDNVSQLPARRAGSGEGAVARTRDL
ncbi:MAG: hypothetical protein LKG23_08695 [Nitrospira sp.]|jgi:hypothetical protein|nr:hypothetical protein [Nitrospira sp.]